MLAGAPRVQNVLAAHSSWDGQSDLPMDESTFKQMMSDAEPKADAPAAAPAAAPPKPASPPRRPRAVAEMPRGMSSLSQWLQLMLAEIARKQEDHESARAETDRRALEQAQRQQARHRRCAARTG